MLTDPRTTVLNTFQGINVDLILYTDRLLVRRKTTLCDCSHNFNPSNCWVIRLCDVHHIKCYEPDHLDNGLRQMSINEDEFDSVYVLYGEQDESAICDLIQSIYQYLPAMRLLS